MAWFGRHRGTQDWGCGGARGVVLSSQETLHSIPTDTLPSKTRSGARSAAECTEGMCSWSECWTTERVSSQIPGARFSELEGLPKSKRHHAGSVEGPIVSTYQGLRQRCRLSHVSVVLLRPSTKLFGTLGVAFLLSRCRISCALNIVTGVECSPPQPLVVAQVSEPHGFRQGDRLPAMMDPRAVSE